MDEIDLKAIKKLIRLKKKQGMDERKIIKFLELSGYPLRLLEEVNRETGNAEETEENGEEVNPLAVRIAGILLFLTALIELFYFFLLFPEFDFLKPGELFIQFLVLFIFTLFSAVLGFGLYKRKYWGFRFGSTLVLLRLLLLGYFVLMQYGFFIFIMALDIVLALIIFMINPFFSDKRKKSEREKLMEEVELHKTGKDKKEIWEK
ncbi:MAG: hypothetical protein COT90_02205 [Candidatus Diapherotrites archaeon CG10_big_fil_rev_8_21_14_0_10_31_34]|nr:MAG: hypothetical protein COT90_02205 [Candidatus Diapherotrites archaeon CG10_big_fil_rev_8_21_14_0_10_31_34]PJA20711.1 MAG: hypothetical protein COX63_00695 [Candidatus Diapherotrites archaeon CG_4_10_14_0_2_um_filter_31_5]